MAHGGVLNEDGPGGRRRLGEEPRARAPPRRGSCARCATRTPDRAAGCASAYSVPAFDSRRGAARLRVRRGGGLHAHRRRTSGWPAELIEAGKHVLVEKPVGPEPGVAERLAAMAARKKTVMTAGYVERFNPAVRAVKGAARGRLAGQAVRPRVPPAEPQAGARGRRPA